jgi:hypothetical protein
VTGQVRPHGELLRAPLSGRPCVAFHVLVQEWHYFNSDTAFSGWNVLLDLRDICPFSVADESGEATVDTTGPTELLLDVDKRGSTRRRDPENRAQRERLTRLLESRGLSTKGSFGLSKKIMYEEAILTAGQQILVGGLGVREVSPDGERSGPRELPERVVLRGTAEEPLQICDSPDVLRAIEMQGT